MAESKDNNQQLRDLWLNSGLTQQEALNRVNAKQLRPLAMSTFKAYMASVEASRRRDCPDELLAHARKVFKKDRKIA